MPTELIGMFGSSISTSCDGEARNIALGAPSHKPNGDLVIARLTAQDQLSKDRWSVSSLFNDLGGLGASQSYWHDLDSDGEFDMVVAAPSSDILALLFLHSPEGVLAPSRVLTFGPRSISQLEGRADLLNPIEFGSAFAARDMDFDDRIEFVIGAPGGSGRIFILTPNKSDLQQGTSLSVTKLAIIDSESLLKFGISLTNNAQFGRALLFLDDLDANECHRLLVGAPGVLDNSGAIFQIGIDSTSFEVRWARELKMPVVPKVNSRFGVSLALAVDLDNDGSKEISIGADERVQSSSGFGFVFVVSLSDSPQDKCEFYATQGVNLSSFGFSCKSGTANELRRIVQSVHESNSQFVFAPMPLSIKAFGQVNSTHIPSSLNNGYSSGLRVGDGFGQAISHLCGSTHHFAVGAPFHDSSQGCVYIFRYPSLAVLVSDLPNPKSGKSATTLPYVGLVGVLAVLPLLVWLQKRRQHKKQPIAVVQETIRDLAQDVLASCELWPALEFLSVKDLAQAIASEVDPVPFVARELYWEWLDVPQETLCDVFSKAISVPTPQVVTDLAQASLLSQGDSVDRLMASDMVSLLIKATVKPRQGRIELTQIARDLLVSCEFWPGAALCESVELIESLAHEVGTLPSQIWQDLYCECYYAIDPFHATEILLNSISTIRPKSSFRMNRGSAVTLSEVPVFRPTDNSRTESMVSGRSRRVSILSEGQMFFPGESPRHRPAKPEPITNATSVPADEPTFVPPPPAWSPALETRSQIPPLPRDPSLGSDTSSPRATTLHFQGFKRESSMASDSSAGLSPDLSGTRPTLPEVLPKMVRPSARFSMTSLSAIAEAEIEDSPK